MAITNIRRHSSGSDGEATRDGKEYTARYLVTSDSELDGPQRVIAALASTNVRIGAYYHYGNDVDPFAWCDRISPRREPGQAGRWNAEVHYAPPTKEKRNEQDEPDSDPENWRDQISITTVSRQLDVERAEYIEGFDSIPHHLKTQQPWGPVTNSAGVPFDPPLQREADLISFRLSRYSKKFPDDLLHQFYNAVNSKDFRINKPKYGLKMLIPKYTAKVANMSGDFEFVNVPEAPGGGLSLWRLNIELLIDFTLGWRVQLVDRGTARILQSGSEDDNGETVSASDTRLDQTTHVSKPQKIVDDAGRPLSEPVLLDGRGELLQAGKEPVYVTYRIYYERDFAALKINRN